MAKNHTTSCSANTPRTPPASGPSVCEFKLFAGITMALSVCHSSHQPQHASLVQFPPNYPLFKMIYTINNKTHNYKALTEAWLSSEWLLAFIMMLLIVFIITVTTSAYSTGSPCSVIPLQRRFCVMALRACARCCQYCPFMARIQIKVWLPAVRAGTRRDVCLPGDCRDSHHRPPVPLCAWCGPLCSTSDEDTTHFNPFEVWSASVW